MIKAALAAEAPPWHVPALAHSSQILGYFSFGDYRHLVDVLALHAL